MFRWGLILLGLFLLWGGIDTYFNHPSELSETPVSVDLDKLQSLIAGKKQQYISYTGSLDLDGRIYKSYIKTPRYTKFSPTDVQTIDAKSFKNIEKYIGAVVQFDLPLAGSYLELQRVREEGDSKTVESTVFVAPLLGTDYRVWVLSPWFTSATSPSNDHKSWLAKKSFSGRLSPLSDLDSNVKNLKKATGELTTLFSQNLGRPVPANALVILGHRSLMTDADAARMKYHVLVEDTDLALYVETTSKKEELADKDGVITGVLTPRESRYYAGFKKALGETSLPERIGFITDETGTEVNEDNLLAVRIGVIGGLIMLSLGGFLVKRKSKKAA